MTLDKQAHYRQAIRKAYPSLHIDSVETIEGGQYNAILVVNGDTIFRFPRFAEALQSMSDEVRVLRGIQGKLPLPVPNPIYANLDRQPIGQAFMGYKMLPGKSTNLVDIEAQYDATTCQRLADQLATFLKTLHSLRVDGIPAAPDTHGYFADMYTRIREKLFPLLPTVACDKLR
jgi:aminoglycoside 2''-phosphotransferase